MLNQSENPDPIFAFGCNDFFLSYLTDMRQQQCFMDVEGEASSNPVCKGQFSKNVTRTDCCCTGVGVAYGSECRLCPKRKTSKIQHQNSPYDLRTFPIVQIRRV